MQNDLDLFKNRDLQTEVNLGESNFASSYITEQNKMTIKELSEVLQVSKELVIKRVNELFPDLMQQGKTTYLTEEQVTKIKLRIEENSSLITTVHDRKQLPKTQLEKKLLIQQAMNFLNEEIEELKQINKQQETLLIEQAPKVQLAETCLRSEKEMSIRDAGKHLGLSQTEIFKIMRDNEYLTKANMPTQKALNRKVLSVKTGESYGDIWKQAVMTLDNIMEFQKRHLGEVK